MAFAVRKKFANTPVGAGAGTHAATHYDGGGDDVDITQLAGYPGGSTDFLREDGTFAAPLGTGSAMPVVLDITSHRWGIDFATPATNAFTKDDHMPAMTGAGSSVSSDDADGANITITTAASSGSTVGRGTTAFGHWRRDWALVVGGSLKTGASLADVGYWAGAFSASPSNNANPAAHLAAFRYYTSVDGTAFWRTCTKDGSTMNAQASAAAIAVNTMYRWYIVMGASTVDFWMNGVLVASHTTELPGATTAMGLVQFLTTLANSAKSFSFYKIWFRHNH